MAVLAKTINRRKVVLSVGLLLSSAVVIGYSAWPAREVRTQGDESAPLTVSFFREDKLGQTIRAYLTCIDFDCFELKEKVRGTGKNAVPPLLSLLQHGLPAELKEEIPGDIKPRVIHLLGATQDARAVTPLTRVLKDNNPLVRAAAAGALAQIGGDDAFEALVPLLKDPEPTVREIIANGLSRLGRPAALEPLRKAVETEDKMHVRNAMNKAIRVLEKQ
jgi:HEAT repeat protein